MEKAIGAGAPTTDGEVSTSDADTQSEGQKRSPVARAEAKAKTPDFVGIRELMAEGVDEQAGKDWLVARKAKRMPLTQTAWNDTKAEAAKFGITVAEAVAMAAKNGWAGFKALYAKNAGIEPGANADA